MASEKGVAYLRGQCQAFANHEEGGMTIREFFAAAILAGAMANEQISCTKQQCCSQAVEIADLLLEQLAKS